MLLSTPEDQEPSEPSILIKQDKMLCLAHKIAKGEAGGKYLYCLEEDKFYHYRNGLWEGLFDVEFLGRVSDYMKEITRYSLSTRKQIAENFKHIAMSKLNTFNWSELINLQNGMLSPYNGQLTGHDWSFYSTNRLPYDYKQDAKCSLWVKTLLEIFEDDVDKLGMLQEFFGYCLTRDTRQHKALLLLGESRSGKSTILNTLRQVIGMTNCSSVPLKYISNPQYTPMLINKLVNIDTDVSAKAEQFEAEFKTITSGEPVQSNQKFVAAFDFVPYCKIVMAANIFPRITDHSSAFYNRLILIPCDRVFSNEEQNRELPSQLLKELPGILNWSIEGLKRLVERGKFPSVKFMYDAVEELENENNPVNLFLEDHVEVDVSGDFYIEKQEFFDKYKQWCVKNNQYNLSSIKFSSCVLKKYHKETPKGSRLNNNGARIWRNIKYIDQKSPPKPKEVTGWQDKEE